MSVLLTGGLGYIGSHTCVELLSNGQDVVVVDNLSNSKLIVKENIEKITGKTFTFYEMDLLYENKLHEIFEKENITSVIHFAGFKAVGESKANPLKYYENNLVSTINLLNVMKKFDVKNIVFSSSATVYGSAESMPITEDTPTGGVSNPYGRTKYFIEEILSDVYASDPAFNIVILRYFNPIGAHESGLIGEDPNDTPNNLMPYITKVATGKLEKLNVFGNDYSTKDGTGVRDYIHVVDLSCGHLRALEKIQENCGLKIYNLGTGTGYSVLDIITTFEKVNNLKLKYEIAPRRPGDIDTCYADPTKANTELNWHATKTLADMCRSSYQFEIKNMDK